MTDEELSALDGRTVLLKTRSGTPVSLGHLRVEPVDDLRAGRRVFVQFETETMQCILGVPAARLADLPRTWDGAMYTYTLPSADSLWIPAKEPGRSSLPAGAPIIEAFPPPRRSEQREMGPLPV